jgi:hypothetical protein
MNNKKVLTEINRINELMGNKLLTETKVATTFITDFIQNLINVSNKTDIINTLTKIKNNPKSFNELLNVLPKLKGNSLAKDLIEKLQNNIVKKTSEHSYIKDALNRGLSGDKIINTMISRLETRYPGIIDDELKQRLTKEIRSKISVMKPKNITDVVEKKWGDVVPLSAKELLRLEKLYSQEGLGKSFFRTMRTFQQSVNDMMTNQIKLMDETLTLIKTYNNITNPADKTRLLLRIGDNFKTLTQRESENYNILNEWITSNIPASSKTLKTKLAKVKGYKRAGLIADNTAYKEWSKNYKSLFERRKNLIKQANTLLNPASWLTPSIMKNKYGKDGGGYLLQVINKWKEILRGPEFSEIRRYTIAGQTQSLKGIRDYGKIYGTIPAVGNVAKELLYSYVVLAASLGVIDYITDVLGNLLRNFESVNDIELVKTQIDSYDKHINPDKSKNTNIEKSGKGFIQFFDDSLIYTLEELEKGTAQIPGMLDNLGMWYYELRNKPVSDENAKELINQGNELKQEIEKNLEKIEQSGQEKISGVKSNDVENFKTFLKSDWGGAYDETKYEITSDGKYYTVKDKQTNDSWYYEKNNDTFKYVAEPTNN